MPEFSTSPQFRLVNPAKHGYQVVEAFTYDTDIFGLHMWIEIPEDFYTDLMSGPKRIKDNLGIDRTFCSAASCLHDWLYKNKYALIATTKGSECAPERLKLSRKDCDRIYLEALELLVNEYYPSTKEHVLPAIYNWLRTWGWLAWYRHHIVNFFTKEKI